MTQKIVISPRFGGFGLSEAALSLGRRLAKSIAWGEYDWDMERDDPILVEVVEKLGSRAASGRFAYLQIAEIPDGVEWTVEEYDGNEWVAEKHRTWTGEPVAARETVSEGES